MRVAHARYHHAVQAIRRFGAAAPDRIDVIRPSATEIITPVSTVSPPSQACSHHQSVVRVIETPVGHDVGKRHRTLIAVGHFRVFLGRM